MPLPFASALAFEFRGRSAVQLSRCIFFARIDFGFREQVVMQVAQIDAGNRADTVFAGDRAGEFRCGNARAHPWTTGINDLPRMCNGSKLFYMYGFLDGCGTD